MKNYRHNHSFQTSKKIYIIDSKKNNYNLNLSETLTCSIDVQIDKWLSYSYKFFAPFFEDEEFENSYTKDSQMDEIDNDFDNALPSWLKVVIDFILRVYQFIVPKKIKAILQIIRTLSWKPFTNFGRVILSNRFNKFCSNPPSP